MGKEFNVQCEHCEKLTVFQIGEIAELDDHIEMVVAAAVSDTEREYEGMVAPDDLATDPRLIEDLSTAITRGDTGEAMILLGRMVEDFGSSVHREAFERGRFARRPG